MTLSKITRVLRDQEERLSLLVDLADTFSRSARRTWGYSPEQIELGRRLMPIVTKGAAGPFLPAALARWYATVGRLPEFTSTQNRLRPPDKLEMQYGVVVIYTENQSCAIWGIRTEDLEQDDPPVVVTDDWGYWGAHWRREADAVSSFALTVGLTELCLHGGRFGCSGTISLDLKMALRSALQSVPVQPLQWPPEVVERDPCFLVDHRVVVLLDEGSLFAAGLDDDVDEHLDELVAPGRIDWTLYQAPSGIRRLEQGNYGLRSDQQIAMGPVIPPLP